MNAKRRPRIAKGRAVTVTELNPMFNQFNPMQAMMKKMGQFQRLMAKMDGAPAGLFRR